MKTIIFSSYERLNKEQIAEALKRKPPKVKTRSNIFIREEDIPRLRIVTRVGELVEIDLLCGDGEKLHKSLLGESQ